MKDYMTISEFASLRNVNINSIRYYEKQKILIPAWIDPQTKYRYYLPEQLGILDAILLCIRLNIPLKELKSYIDSNGNLDKKGLLEKGKAVMQAKIDAMQTGIAITQFNLDSIEQNKIYSKQKGIYTREIEERFLIEAPIAGKLGDFIQKEKMAMDLFHKAQAQNMAPVFPAGILIHYDSTLVSYSFFFRVLNPPKENGQIIKIPRAIFHCLQAELTQETNVDKIIEENFQIQDQGTVIISNMILDKSHFDSRHSEIQVPQTTFD